MALESPVPRSAAGIVEDSESHSRRVPTTLRSDGTARKELKIRPGFTPLEDVGRFRSPRVAQRAAREGSPQLGAGLGGRSLESWANDALKDQGMQASPLRGGGPSFGSRSTPSSFRSPPVFPSLSALGDALPSTSSSSSSRLNEPAPHQAPLDPSTSSAPSSSPPRRPWPSRNQPSSTDTNSIASTPPTRPSSPPPPPLHAPHAMVTDTLEQNKAPPSPASYSKTRRTEANGNASSSSSQQPHTVQSDWNAAKHCFTAPPTNKPQQHRRTSSSSAGTAPSQTGGGASLSNAPPSSFNNTAPKRRGQGHGRSNSSTSSNTSTSTSANKTKPSTSTSPSIPQSPPRPQRPTSSSASSFSSPRAPQSRPDLISPPAPLPIDSPPLIIVKLPPSRIKVAPPIEQPTLVAPASTTDATFNNKPIPTGPRNPGPAPAAKRVGGSWGAPAPAPAPAPATPTPSSTANASKPKPTPPHLLPTPTPAPAPTALLLAPLVPSLPPPTAPPPTTRPPRAKSAGGTWGLQASTTSSSSTTTPSEAPLEVAVHLPPSEAKLVPQQQANAPRVSVPVNGSKKKNGHRRGNSSISAPPPPPNVPRVVEPKPTSVVVKPPVPVEPKKVVVVETKEEEHAKEEKAQELDLPVLDDPAAWGVPLSGRSWADDDDSF